MALISVLGRLGQTPELVTVGSSETKMLRFSICESQRQKVGGSWTDVPAWFPCVLFGVQAEWVARDASKGCWVYVEGELQAQQWTDREGQQRSGWQIKCQRARVVGQRQRQPGEDAPPARGQRSTGASGGWQAGAAGADIPF